MRKTSFPPPRKTGRQKLELDRDTEDWIAQALDLPRVISIPITARIATVAGTFGKGFHGDAADRIIAATALDNNCLLITKDKKIRAYDGVKTIW